MRNKPTITAGSTEAKPADLPAAPVSRKELEQSFKALRTNEWEISPVQGMDNWCDSYLPGLLDQQLDRLIERAEAERAARPVKPVGRPRIPEERRRPELARRFYRHAIEAGYTAEEALDMVAKAMSVELETIQKYISA